MLVFSSAEMTNSSLLRGFPSQERSYRWRIRLALTAKAGSRGKIQLRWYQGRRAVQFPFSIHPVRSSHMLTFVQFHRAGKGKRLETSRAVLSGLRAVESTGARLRRDALSARGGGPHRCGARARVVLEHELLPAHGDSRFPGQSRGLQRLPAVQIPRRETMPIEMPRVWPSRPR